MASARLIPQSYKRDRVYARSGTFLDATLGGRHHNVFGQGMTDAPYNIFGSAAHDAKPIDAKDQFKPAQSFQMGPTKAEPPQYVSAKDTVPPEAYQPCRQGYRKPRVISIYSKQDGLKASQRKKKLRFKGFGLSDKLQEKIAQIKARLGRK